MVYISGVLIVASDLENHECLRKGGLRQPGAPRRGVFPPNLRSDLAPIFQCGSGPVESTGTLHAREIYAALLKLSLSVPNHPGQWVRHTEDRRPSSPPPTSRLAL